MHNPARLVRFSPTADVRLPDGGKRGKWRPYDRSLWYTGMSPRYPVIGRASLGDPAHVPHHQRRPSFHRRFHG